jgi:hypothetical protein
MTKKECLYYIKSKNLDLRSIEQIVTFFFDDDIRFCGNLNWWEKKCVTKTFHGDNFINIWPKAVKEIERISRKKAGLK